MFTPYTLASLSSHLTKNSINSINIAGYINITIPGKLGRGFEVISMTLLGTGLEANWCQLARFIVYIVSLY